MSQLSEVGITNRAFDKLGVERINDFEESSKAARLAKENYPHTRDCVLESHPWNFAIKRSTLSQSATDPNHGFDNAFLLPSDTLRVLHPLTFSSEPRQDVIWQREGSTIITNEDEFKIRYISRVTDTSLFSNEFTEALILKLAAEFAYPLVQSRALSESMEAKFQLYLRNARGSDAQVGTPEQMGADVWINARNRGTSFDASDF